MKFTHLFPLAAMVLCAVIPTGLAADTPQMQNRMNDYFEGERGVSLFLMGTGIASLGTGTYMLLQSEGIYRGISYPFLVLGVFQLIIGGSIYLRTDKQVENLSKQLATDPQAYIRDETARMSRVNNTFNIIKTAEVIVMLAGGALALFGKSPAWQGVGLGLAIQGSLMLSVDVTAQRRGALYVEDITQFSLSYKIN